MKSKQVACFQSLCLATVTKQKASHLKTENSAWDCYIKHQLNVILSEQEQSLNTANTVVELFLSVRSRSRDCSIT